MKPILNKIKQLNRILIAIPIILWTSSFLNYTALGETAGKPGIKFKSPYRGQVIKTGELVPLKISLSRRYAVPDSIQYLIDTTRIGATLNSKGTFIWEVPIMKVGPHSITAKVYASSRNIQTLSTQVLIYPGTPAIEYSYKVIKEYPHDKEAYTQGLLFDQNDILESTGLKGKSTLRRINSQTGKVLTMVNLPDTVFGEGIATFDDKIVQVSWQEQTAFQYEKNTFSLQKKINYLYKEGWGLTYDGNHLILSDGSENLYFVDKTTFSEINRISVYDDQGPVRNLNELEYIDGEVWANVYFSDVVVRIDPQTGIVKGKINLAGILKPEDRTKDTNVLNGIAYNPQTKTIWVTGKNWPKLFEIKLEEKGR